MLVKSVPVGGQHLRIENGQLTRKGVPHGPDPINEVAIEWALRLKEAGQVDKVIAISMGPDEAKEALRGALARRCDVVQLIQDPKLVQSDVRTTAYVLAAAIRKSGARLAFFGNESLDGSSGAVPAAVATLLDWPLISLARTLTLGEGTVRARRDLGASPELVEADLPAVVSFVAGGVDPRYPKLKMTLQARLAPIPAVNLDALGVEISGSGTREKVVRLEATAVAAKSTRIITADVAVDELERIVKEAQTARG